MGQDGVVSMEIKAQAGQLMNSGLIPSRTVTFSSPLKHPDWLLDTPSSLVWGLLGRLFLLG